MKKTIIINENAFKSIKNIMIREALTKAPFFGKYDDYTAPLSQLSKVPNLRVDRYKDYQLEDAYNAWKDTGYDKNSKEYYIYITEFKHFMFGEGGLLAHVSYTADRTTYKDRNGVEKPVPLHRVILDRDWADQIVNAKDWKYSNANSNVGAADKQCFYTTILKLYQNPVVWNDFFFNPVFKEYAQKFFRIRDALSDLFKENMENYKTNYSPLLPTKEYAELNKFVGIIEKIYDEAKKNVIGWEIKNRGNQKEDLFYDPKFGTAEDSFEADTEDDM